MGKDLIGYNVLVDGGLRSVVRETLRRVAADGWPGTHHAYITFKTGAPGVDVPDSLSARYPDELTIVLQNQFWDLEVADDSFAVTLSFNKFGERITVPFAALTSYADPSVKFGLQFGPAQRPASKWKSPEARETGSVPAAGRDKALRVAGEDKVRAGGWRRGRRTGGGRREVHAGSRRRRGRAGGGRREDRDARPLPQEIAVSSVYSSHSRLPQTPINCPVMLRAASCARKNAASATSSHEISERVEMKLA